MTTYCCFFFAYIVFASNVQQFYIMCMKWGEKNTIQSRFGGWEGERNKTKGKFNK